MRRCLWIGEVRVDRAAQCLRRDGARIDVVPQVWAVPCCRIRATEAFHKGAWRANLRDGRLGRDDEERMVTMKLRGRHARANCRRPVETSLLILLWGALFALPCVAQTIEDNDDILQGQTYLVRSDDLVLADPAYVPGTTDMTKVDYFPFDTDNMLITTSGSISPTNLVTLSCTAKSSSNEPFPQQTQTMRMFNLPYDVIVTFAPTQGAAGADCSNQSGRNDLLRRRSGGENARQVRRPWRHPQPLAAHRRRRLQRRRLRRPAHHHG